MEWTPLYGGRTWLRPQLSWADLAWAYDRGIGFRIPLQNVCITRAMYLEHREFLAKHHRPGNSVILVKRDIAEWIAEDFPHFERELSVIAKTKTVEQLARQLDLFDVVVPHPQMNERLDDLAKIADKSRVRLFADAGCLLRCPTMSCYAAVSRFNLAHPGTVTHLDTPCARFSHPGSEYRRSYPEWSMQWSFDVDKLVDLGFRKFKTLGRSMGGAAVSTQADSFVPRLAPPTPSMEAV